MQYPDWAYVRKGPNRTLRPHSLPPNDDGKFRSFRFERLEFRCVNTLPFSRHGILFTVQTCPRPSPQ